MTTYQVTPSYAASSHTSASYAPQQYEYASGPDASLEAIPRYSQIRHERASGMSLVDVPTAVRTLLATAKELQRTLEQWSQSKVTDDDVSDVYVKIGHEFNATISAFGRHGIDLSDMHCIPAELRVVLEQCLSEEPSAEVLQRFLPELRGVLVKLLKGLQGRQGAWRAAVRLNG